MIMNVVTIVLFAAAAIVEFFALREPRVSFSVSEEGYGRISGPDAAETRKFRRLTTLALFLTTAGGFASLWAPGFVS